MNDLIRVLGMLALIAFVAVQLHTDATGLWPLALRTFSSLLFPSKNRYGLGTGKPLGHFFSGNFLSGA